MSISVNVLSKSRDKVSTRCEMRSNEITIGRSEDCELRFQNEAVSQKHARIYKDKQGLVKIFFLSFTNRQLWLQNLSQVNPTLVNAQKVAEPVQITQPDNFQFHICGRVFILSVGDSSNVENQDPNLANNASILSTPSKKGIVKGKAPTSVVKNSTAGPSTTNTPKPVSKPTKGRRNSSSSLEVKPNTRPESRINVLATPLHKNVQTKKAENAVRKMALADKKNPTLPTPLKKDIQAKGSRATSNRPAMKKVLPTPLKKDIQKRPANKQTARKEESKETIPVVATQEETKAVEEDPISQVLFTEEVVEASEEPIAQTEEPVVQTEEPSTVIVEEKPEDEEKQDTEATTTDQSSKEETVQTTTPSKSSKKKKKKVLSSIKRVIGLTKFNTPVRRVIKDRKKVKEEDTKKDEIDAIFDKLNNENQEDEDADDEIGEETTARRTLPNTVERKKQGTVRFSISNNEDIFVDIVDGVDGDSSEEEDKCPKPSMSTPMKREIMQNKKCHEPLRLKTPIRNEIATKQKWRMEVEKEMKEVLPQEIIVVPQVESSQLPLQTPAMNASTPQPKDLHNRRKSYSRTTPQKTLPTPIREEINQRRTEDLHQVARKMATPMKREIAAKKKCFTPKTEAPTRQLETVDEVDQDFSSTQKALFHSSELEESSSNVEEEIDVETVDEEEAEVAILSSSPLEKDTISEEKPSTPRTASTPKVTTPNVSSIPTPKTPSSFSVSVITTPKSSTPRTPVNTPVQNLGTPLERRKVVGVRKLGTPLRQAIQNRLVSTPQPKEKTPKVVDEEVVSEKKVVENEQPEVAEETAQAPDTKQVATEVEESPVITQVVENPQVPEEVVVGTEFAESTESTESEDVKKEDTTLSVQVLHEKFEEIWNIVREETRPDGERFSKKLLRLPSSKTKGSKHYYKVVAQPIDLQGIKKRIGSYNYSSVEEFKENLERLFSNAILYAGDIQDQDYLENAKTLQSLFRKEFAARFEQPKESAQVEEILVQEEVVTEETISEDYVYQHPRIRSKVVIPSPMKDEEPVEEPVEQTTEETPEIEPVVAKKQARSPRRRKTSKREKKVKSEEVPEKKVESVQEVTKEEVVVEPKEKEVESKPEEQVIAPTTKSPIRRGRKRSSKKETKSEEVKPAVEEDIPTTKRSKNGTKGKKVKLMVEEEKEEQVNVPSFTVEQIQNMKVVDLKKELKERGVSTSGLKNELIVKLIKAVGL